MYHNKCDGCLWDGNCPGAARCDDYTPIDATDGDVRYYEGVVFENIEEYRRLVEEQQV